MKKPPVTNVTEEFVLREIEKVELDEQWHEAFYNELRKAAETVSSHIRGEYDFGLT